MNFPQLYVNAWPIQVSCTKLGKSIFVPFLFSTIRPPKTCFLIQPNKMILSPMLDGLISPITAGHLEKICRKALLSVSGVCVFPSHLLVNFQESAIKVIGWEVTVSWITTLTLASLIILSSSAKGYAHPCGFKPQWFTFTKALSPSRCCLPSVCAHVVWPALAPRTFGQSFAGLLRGIIHLWGTLVVLE